MSVLLINSMANKIPLATGSVHMVATSPPYYGLRDYGLPPTDWPVVEFVPMAGLPAVTVPAWTGCLGLEPDPLMFVAHIVLVMREARRVLRDDGTAWVNFGDSYSGAGAGGGGNRKGNEHGQHDALIGKGVRGKSSGGLKAKDLTGIPWRVAFALQADGWWLRSDVIWSKDNPMPESVNGWRWERHWVKSDVSKRDDGASWDDCPGCAKCNPNGGYVLRRGSWRPTSSHEYVFMLAKSEDYYSDKQAVEEPLAESSIERISQTNFANQTGGEKDYANGVNSNRSARKTLENFAARAKENKKKKPKRGGGPFSQKYADNQPGHGGKSNYREGEGDTETGRNKRSVWNVNPKPYPGAHFATWPPELVEPMIKSSTSERGVCPACGAPWVRVVERGDPQARPDNPNPVRPYDAASGCSNGTGATTLHMTRQTDTIDWRPSCDCPECDPVPAVVLDIFAGSGTTLQVARQLGRHGIGLDLSFSYLRNEARSRLSLDAIYALENGGGIVSSKNPKGRKPADGQMGLPLFD